MATLRNISTVSLILLLFFALPGRSQTSGFIAFGVEQGLAQAQVQTMVQDNEGNLWVGTMAGLSKYNGQSFTNYTRRDGLAEDWVTAAFKDKRGDLWFGHWAGGVTRYNVNRQKFESMNLEEYTHFHTITAITEDNKGFLWIATEGAGIYIYDIAKNQMYALDKKDGLASANVYDLCFDTNANMWIATDHGITICDTKADITSPAAYTDLNAARGFVSDYITCFALLNNGREMWVGTADKGVVVMQLPPNFVSRNAPTLIPTLRRFSTADGLGADFVEAICTDRSAAVWIGTAGGGVSRITPGNSKARFSALDKAAVRNFSTRQGLSYFNVRCLLQDREGAVWIGTDVGLNQYRGERFTLFDRQDGFPNDIVWATCADRLGNIWLGTNAGLVKMSFYTMPENGDQRFTIRTYTTADGLGADAVLSLHEDAAGRIWAGTNGGGVSFLELGSEQFETIKISDSLTSNMVYAISSDRSGNIWIGTRNGASCINPSNQAVRNFTTADGLGGNNVYRIYCDSRGQLWFGSLGGYLSVYNGKTFTRYDETSGIVHRFILCISEDNNHNIWFGAYGGGLYMYDGRTFRNYTRKNGLSTESPYAIIADKMNNIWIGNSRGLDCFVTRDSTFSHFGRSEGFPGTEVNPNAVCTDRDGNLWFGTVIGAVRFSPKENYQNTIEPVVSISGLRIFMRDAAFPEENRFSYDQNYLTFVFTGISLTSPEKVRYQYKLEGFDNEWSPVPTHVNEATYSNLPPGEYTFLVRACNNDGVWNREPAKYKFTIKPPYWQTALFYAGMVLFIGFCIFGFDRFRTRSLQKQKKALEDQVNSRTNELALRNDELAQKNKEITDSIRYAKRLQDAMLIPAWHLRRDLPDSFVLFKPKDIVSGDFWFYRRKQNSILLAALDCTGHGVPGAFMSIMANDLLEQVVAENENADPAVLLNRLNVLMSEKMRYQTDELHVREGFDIALVKFDLQTRNLEYAGSYNPLLHFRGRQMSELQADKISVGSWKPEMPEYFNTQTLQLNPGDSFYIFSDGFSDQFGGPQGKKFKSTQFKALLLSVQGLEMAEQERTLNRTIENWRGDIEQIDDMLVIGIRIS
jgi:ligand-binding sensor domain-containing protein/serine phosphatase RsbU (regulator of sigma subunit)